MSRLYQQLPTLIPHPRPLSPEGRGENIFRWSIGVTPSTREGFLYGLAAYGWWGLVPFYFHWLGNQISPFDILAHRIVWSVVLLAVVLTLLKRWRPTLQC